MAPPADPIEQLRLELAVMRLLSRAVVTFVVCSSPRPPEETLCEISSMLAGTGPYAIPVTDMDPDLYRQAQPLARERMTAFLEDLGRHRLASYSGRPGAVRLAKAKHRG